VANEKAAKEIMAQRDTLQRAGARNVAERPLTLDELFAKAKAGEAKVLRLVVKTGVQGTVEPVVNSVEELSDEVRVEVIHSAAGDITESDVNLAAASGAVVVGFRVNPDPAARRAAAQQGVEIREYEVIYKLVEDVTDAQTGLREPVYVDTEIGRAEVRAIFTVPRVGRIAGCYVTSGVVRRNATARVLRGSEEFPGGSVSSLKRFTEDVREVREGFECGIGLSDFQNIREGDVILFTIRERQR
jgi:translation initiation factor IF-2